MRIFVEKELISLENRKIMSYSVKFSSVNVENYRMKPKFMQDAKLILIGVSGTFRKA